MTSTLTQFIEKRRDAAPIVSSCTCGEFTVRGPAGEARERMRGHRAEAHPDRPLVAKRPTPPPQSRPSRAELDEGRRLSRNTASRKPKKRRAGGGARGRAPYSKLREGTFLQELHERYMSGDERYGTKPLVEGLWQELGYASAASCAGAVRALWRELGLPIRAAGGFVGPRPDVAARQSPLSPEHLRVVHELWAAGARTSRIARLCWREWGYAAEHSLAAALYHQARRLPADEQPALVRTGPKRWVGSIPEEQARRMLLDVAPAAA